MGLTLRRGDNVGLDLLRPLALLLHVRVAADEGLLYLLRLTLRQLPRMRRRMRP